VLRAGVMTTGSLERAAERTFAAHALYGISVEGVIGRSVLEACRSSERISGYRQIRLSTFGRLRKRGFVLLATFDHPHFTVALPDLSDITLARLRSCFDAPIPNPASSLEELALDMVAKEARVHEALDLAVDFMDMTDDRRLLTRVVDARPGYEPAVGEHVVVGDDDAEPRVARILSIDVEGIIEVEVLPGSVDSHRRLLGRSSTRSSSA
jgi:hypothetical protein